MSDKQQLYKNFHPSMLEMATKYKLFLDTVQVNHPILLLQQLDHLRKQESLTDVTIVIEDKHYPVHKIILAGSSDYFRVMFTAEMKEKREDKIFLKNVTKEGFDIILNYMYTSTLNLNECNALQVLQTAHFLQMIPVVESCVRYLQSSINVENCIDVMYMGDYYQLEGLKEIALKYICANINSLFEKKLTRTLSSEQMKWILSSDLPMECKELDLLRIVIDWIFHESTELSREDISICRGLLRYLHYKEMNTHGLRKMLQEHIPHSKHSRIYDNPIYKAINGYSDPCTAFINFDNINFNKRGMVKALINVGGFGSQGMTNEINFLVLGQPIWQRLSTIPHIEQCNFGTAVVDNELYVVGGCYNQYMQEFFHNYVFKYTPRTDSWTKLSPLNRDRCRFTLTVLGTCLYATGGEVHGEYDNEETSLCERYNIQSNNWEEIARLPVPLTQHAACSHNIRGQEYIIVSGGLSNDEISPHIIRYEPIENEWLVIGNLSIPRADHTMVSFDGRLYVAGGWQESAAHAAKIAVADIEVYDLVTGTFAVIARIENPRRHSAITLEGSRLWITGGYQRDNREFPTACLDLDTVEWIPKAADPEMVWEHQSQILYVPKVRRELKTRLPVDRI